MRLVEVDGIGEVLEDMEALGLGPDGFTSETKFNGWLVQAAGGRLWSRRGKELTRKFPEIAAAIAPYTAEHLVGELVYWTPGGTMDEPTVTTVAGTADPREAAAKLEALPGRFEYVLFDAIALLGCDVSVLPTRDRRDLLLQAVEPFGPLRISEARPFEDWSRVYDEAVAAGGDGVVLKNVHAPYVWRPLGQSEARPTGAWYKLKPAVTDDFVVVGLHPGPKGKLVVELAQYHRGRPVHVSEMSNLSRADERGFRGRFEEGPFVVEVEFQARFPDPPGALQHPRLVRVREDKRPEDATLPDKYALGGAPAMGPSMEGIFDWFRASFCRPWERSWRGMCVDSELRDEWLDRMNAIPGITIFSTCAGHPQRPGWSSSWVAFWPSFHPGGYPPGGAAFEPIFGLGTDERPANDEERRLDGLVKRVLGSIALVQPSRTISGHRVFHAESPIPRSAMAEGDFIGWWEGIVDRLERLPYSEKNTLKGGPAMGVAFVSHHWITPEGEFVSLPIGVAHIVDAIERGMESVLDALRRGWIRVIGRGVHWDFDAWDITDDRTLSTVEDFLSRILHERGGFRALIETQLPSWTTFSVSSDDLQGRSVREAVLDALRRERIFGR
jgi:hypothetical protein